MARTARGADNLEWAREVLAQAQTVEQLRQAQAVVLPLDYGLSMEQTARAIGRSVPWTCRLRNRFLAGEIVGDGQRKARGGRRRQNMTAEQERELLAPFLERASTGGTLVVGQVKAELGKPDSDAQWHCPRSTTCCTATAGASSPRTSATRKAIRWFSRSGKKLPERFAQIRALWPGQPRLRQHRRAQGSPRNRAQGLRAGPNPPMHQIHRRLALDY